MIARTMSASHRRLAWRKGLAGSSCVVVAAACLLSVLLVGGPAGAANSCASIMPGPPPPPGREPPVASFTATPGSVAAGQAVSFDGSASYGRNARLTMWCWTFGDGAVALGAKVSHTYRGAGAYAASLTVTDEFGLTGGASRMITVKPPQVKPKPKPKLTLRASSKSVARGKHVRLSGTLTPARGGQVAIEHRDAKGVFHLLLATPLHTAHHKTTFSVQVTVERRGTYRARVRGTHVVSAPVTLSVHG
jgi:hypothetical protein